MNVWFPWPIPMSPCFLGRPNTIRISSEGNGSYSTLCDGGWSGFISPRVRVASLNKNLDKALQPRMLWPDCSTTDKENKKGTSLFFDLRSRGFWLHWCIIFICISVTVSVDVLETLQQPSIPSGTLWTYIHRVAVPNLSRNSGYPDSSSTLASVFSGTGIVGLLGPQNLSEFVTYSHPSTEAKCCCNVVK